MEYLIAIVYGVVQGLGEFLPISSSGHLVLLHEFLPTPFADELAFDVTLHLGTLVAVFWFFRADIAGLSRSFIRSLSRLPAGFNDLSWLIILATIPAALVGMLFGDFLEESFSSPLQVAFMLAIVAVLFILVERYAVAKTELSGLDHPKAIMIGLAQVLALLPGTSRSGITIITGLSLGLKREAAVRFSFLLSLPIIAGAAILKVPQFLSANLAAGDWFFLGLAFFSATLSGFWAIGFLLRFVKTETFKPFAYYRLILAGLIIALVAMNVL